MVRSEMAKKITPIGADLRTGPKIRKDLLIK
jgi:hypothetical protein